MMTRFTNIFPNGFAYCGAWNEKHAETRSMLGKAHVFQYELQATLSVAGYNLEFRLARFK